MSKQQRLALGYALIAWITFGHAWATIETRWVDAKLIGAAGSAAAWPLYLSVKIWELVP